MQDQISTYCDHKNEPDITYKFVDTNFFVVSGFCGETIFYNKVYVGEGHINYLYFSYSKYDKSLYDSVVSHLSHSFQSGRLN